MTDETGSKLDISLPIRGMTCAACVMHVEHALKETPGVLAATVNLATEKAAVSLERGAVPLDELRHSVADAGYEIGTTDTTLNVGGMTCAACVMHVEHALRAIPGVMDTAVNLATERARVSYVPGLAGITDFREALEDSGYRLDGIEGDERDSAAEMERLARTEEIRYFRTRCSFAVSAGIVLLLGSMHLFPWVSYLEWLAGRLAGGLAVGLVAIGDSGAVLGRVALLRFRHTVPAPRRGQYAHPGRPGVVGGLQLQCDHNGNRHSVPGLALGKGHRFRGLLRYGGLNYRPYSVGPIPGGQGQGQDI